MSPDDLRKNLAQLAVLGRKTQAAGDALHGQARERRDAVLRELGEVRPKVLTDPDAEQRYQDLVEEDGRLARILQS